MSYNIEPQALNDYNHVWKNKYNPRVVSEPMVTIFGQMSYNIELQSFDDYNHIWKNKYNPIVISESMITIFGVKV